MGDLDFYAALSKDELIKAVSRNFDSEDVTINNFQLVAASDTPLGFMGIHFKAKGSAMVAGVERQFNYFVKKIPKDVPSHHQYATDVGAFFKEVQFMETVVQDIKSNLKGKHKKWCAEMYFSRGDEIVLFEDLTTQGYYMYPERTLLDLPHILATMRALAAMHAAPLILMAKYKNGTAPSPPPNWEPHHPADLSLLYNHIIYETECSGIPGHFGNRFYEAGFRSQVPVVDLLPGYTEEQRQNIKKHLPNILRRLFKLVEPSDRFRNTWIHGDLWSNNIMFKDENNSVDAIIVDYQLARYAPPGHEVIMFLHLVQSRAFLLAHQSQILKFYYSCLTEEVANEGLEVESILPKAEFLESCDHYYEFGVLTKVMFYQLILSPADIQAKFLSTPDMFSRIFLVDRSDMILETYRTDELCRTRIIESMQELIEFHQLDDLNKWKDIALGDF